MRQDRLYTLVGMFVIGAICLTIVTSIFFYEQYLQEKVETYVMFFKGSLAGVDISSTVAYRGVKIGEVKLIEITENVAGDEIEIPVFVQFFVENRFGIRQNPVQLLIKKGYVANIQSPNFLTGVASIELTKSDSPEPIGLTTYRGYPVFPTQVNVKNYMTMDQTLRAAKQAFLDMSEFVHSDRLHDTIDAAKNMANSFDKLANKLDNQLPPFFITLDHSLRQVSSAAAATQNLTDYLARYPESLLRGRK